jgi:hypothetical protein
MDPYSAQIVAATRGADFHRAAEESRVAASARRSREDERPASRPDHSPERRAARTRRPGLVQ